MPRKIGAAIPTALGVTIRIVIAMLVCGACSAADPASPINDSFPGANKVYSAYSIPEPSADWIAKDFFSPGSDLQKALPPHGFEVLESTPHFHWPWQGDKAIYQLEIFERDSGLKVIAQSVGPGKNWYRLTKKQALSPGKWYRWRVTDGKRAWSDFRDFGVAVDAVQYTVPSAAELTALSKSRPHPRILPVGNEWRRIVENLDPQMGLHKDWTKATLGELKQKVMGAPMAWEGDGAPGVATSGDAYTNMVNLIFLWKLTAATARASHSNPYHDEALKRLLSMIAPYQGRTPKAGVNGQCDFRQTSAYDGDGRGWIVGQLNGCYGKTTFRASDQAARTFMLAMAVGWDALHDELSASQKTQFAKMLGYRLNEWLTLPLQVLGRDYAKHLENSHGINTVWQVALTAMLLAGDEAELGGDTVENFHLASNLNQVLANENYLPLQLSVFSPFILQDGGPGRGFGYASGDTPGSWVDMARRITGIDVFSHPKYRLVENAWLETVPYGAIPGDGKSGHLQLFGDGAIAASQRGASDLVATLYRRHPTPQGAAYLNSYGTFFRSYYPGLLSLWADIPDGFPFQSKSLEHRSHLFEITGIYASQSSIQDPGRSMLWFISGYFGGYNHNHDNQNSFIFSSRGRNLLIDSGYFDGYGSPHWLNWYRQTPAKNAITLNDRKGHQRGAANQNSAEARANTGRITKYVDHDSYALVQGDALQAYQMPGYEMSKAFRTLIHVYPDVVFVIDDFALKHGRNTWEWNFHTQVAPRLADGVVTIVDGPASVSVQALWGNNPVDQVIVNDNAWPANAVPYVDYDGNRPGRVQWHNRFTFPSAASLQLVMLLTANGAAVNDLTQWQDNAGWHAAFEYAGKRYAITYDFVQGNPAVTVTPKLSAQGLKGRLPTKKPPAVCRSASVKPCHSGVS